MLYISDAIVYDKLHRIFAIIDEWQQEGYVSVNKFLL